MDDEKPRSKGDKRDRTRAKLIEAASAIIQEDGFGAASLDAIAQRAGMTKGAIYSNFKDKAELLVAVRSTRAPMFSPAWEFGAPLRRQLRLVAEALVANLPRIQAEARFVAQYQLHAQQDEELRRKLVAHYNAMFAQADMLFSAGPDNLRMSGRDVMIIVQAAAQGLIHQSFLTPDAITHEIVFATFDAIAIGVVDAS